MTHYTITNYGFHHKEGINKQQCLDQHLTGKHSKHDSVRWDRGSDIPEFHMSVKSAKFSLVAGGQLRGETMSEMLDDFFARVASISFAYVTKDYKVYVMDAHEFREFLDTFGYFSYESQQNNGLRKIKAKSESKAMIEWLQARVA